MARTVADAAAPARRHDRRRRARRATRASRGKARTDYTKSLDPAGLKGARIGVCFRSSLRRQPAGRPRLRRGALAAMKSAGARSSIPSRSRTAGKFGDDEFEVLLYEFKADLNAYLAVLGPDAPVHTLDDVIAFNDRHRDREMPYFGQEIFEQARDEGAADRRRLQEGAGEVPPAVAQGGDRRGDAPSTSSTRWWRHQRPGVADRPGQRRLRRRRQLLAGGGRRLSEHHRARRLRPSACRWGCPSSAGLERGRA